MNIAFLASGKLGLQTISSCSSFIDPTFIATDNKSGEIINYAQSKEIPFFSGNPRNKRLYQFAEGFSVDVLLSINYLFLIEKEIIELARYSINLHGSLLPKYRGRTPHVWSIINNEKETGVTAHLITEECDAGDIVLQKAVQIDDNDTGASILAKYENAYPEMIFIILNRLTSNGLRPIKQDHNLATYFGKRTAADGEINWGWQKERINNWVRAQAYPYPGAFTYLSGKKVIIDKINYSEKGFDSAWPDGLIIEDSPDIIIKTPNGGVILDSVRTNKEYCLKGKILGNENR